MQARTTRRNRWRGLWLIASVVLALPGCRDRSTDEVRVTVIAGELPAVTDPTVRTASPADLILIQNVAQGLVRFDAAGNIAPGLAERWAVSDDGLSYVFRLQKTTWSDGRKVKARDIVRLLQRQLSRAGADATRDTIGAIGQVVAMTDQVIAIELNAPRPHLLQLLAQPEFGLVRGASGTGPFRIGPDGGELRLSRALPGFDGDEGTRESLLLAAAPADRAVASFIAGKTQLVLGGTSADLAVALGAKLPRNALHLDPVAGLFGLVPASDEGLAADRDVRTLLDEALDRAALVSALGAADLQPRTSILQPGLDGVTALATPSWAAVPLAERQPALIERARKLFAPAPKAARKGAPETEPTLEPTMIRVSVPDGPGGVIILQRLKADWGPLGIDVEAVPANARADFRWVDAVAPSTSPAWFLRNFRCEFVPVCSVEADQLLDAARLTGFGPQRSSFFAEAERKMREEVLFIPVAAPIRWSLVDRSITGFADNRFARHTLTGLRAAPATQD